MGPTPSPCFCYRVTQKAVETEWGLYWFPWPCISARHFGGKKFWFGLQGHISHVSWMIKRTLWDQRVEIRISFCYVSVLDHWPANLFSHFQIYRSKLRKLISTRFLLFKLHFCSRIDLSAPNIPLFRFRQWKCEIPLFTLSLAKTRSREIFFSLQFRKKTHLRCQCDTFNGPLSPSDTIAVSANLLDLSVTWAPNPWDLKLCGKVMQR